MVPRNAKTAVPWAAALTACSVAAAPARATAQDPTSAAGRGAGSAIRAGGADVGVVSVSPAAMALDPRYDLAVGGGLGPDALRGVHVGAMDSASGPVALGIAWAMDMGEPAADPDDLPGWVEEGSDLVTNPTNPTTTNALYVSAAGAWMDRKLALGVGGRRTATSSRLDAAESAFDATASVAARPSKAFTTAASVEGLVPGDGGLSPLRIGGGARLGESDGPAAEVDLVVEPGRDEVLDVFGGADARPWKPVALRAGWQWTAGTHAATAGIGAVSEAGAIDYAARIAIDGRSWHTLSVRLMF